MLQDYLVDHDRTAGSLGFKEVFLVPKKGSKSDLTKSSKSDLTKSSKSDLTKRIKAFLLNQPEEAHELSTEDRVVALP